MVSMDAGEKEAVIVDGSKDGSGCTHLRYLWRSGDLIVTQHAVAVPELGGSLVTAPPAERALTVPDLR
jgi:hypothetical protein